MNCFVSANGFVEFRVRKFLSLFHFLLAVWEIFLIAITNRRRSRRFFSPTTSMANTVGRISQGRRWACYFTC